MTEEVEFLFDADLVAAVINLIRSAKHKLVLISPFIDLDARVMDALNEKKGLHNFELYVLFGKNENNYLKSIKKDSLEFLKEFPNIEIRYNDRLHAKFYQNDYEYIMTSLNLYDYSLANNIEVGIRVEYAFKGLMGKAIDLTTGAIGEGIELVKHNVLGVKKDVNPMQSFDCIFNASELKYKTEPIVAEKTGIFQLMGGKKLDGFDVVVDCLKQPAVSVSGYSVSTTTSNLVTEVNTRPTVDRPVTNKCVSASQLSKTFGVHAKDITHLMETKGLIHSDQITDLGYAKGLIMKNYMGTNYIAYPDSLEEFRDLKQV
jgi:hypothetical protein